MYRYELVVVAKEVGVNDIKDAVRQYGGVPVGWG
jgi:hypothetical protein